MKYFAGLLLLILSNQAFSLDAKQCADGTITISGATCRPYISVFNIGDTLTDTSTNHFATVDVTSGTFYTATYLSSATSDHPVVCSGVIAGTNAADTSSKIITSASVEMDGGDNASGLTAEQMYTTFSCAVNGVRQGKVAQAEFTTLAAPGGGGTDLTGAGAFVAKDDQGNTDETPTGTAGTATSGCTSMAASCSELSHPSTPTGANIYLSEGGTWEDDWQITWDGTSGDPVVIGCYFDEGDDDGNPVQCTSF